MLASVSTAALTPLSYLSSALFNALVSRRDYYLYPVACDSHPLCAEEPLPALDDAMRNALEQMLTRIPCASTNASLCARRLAEGGDAAAHARRELLRDVLGSLSVDDRNAVFGRIWEVRQTDHERRGTDTARPTRARSSHKDSHFPFSGSSVVRYTRIRAGAKSRRKLMRGVLLALC